MPTDSFSYALERLDPASRALLDLSLRRGMRTEEIAEVLGAEPENVEASRDEALQRIASEVGIDELDEVRARLAELPADEWLGRTNGNGAVHEAEAEEPAPAVETAEEPKRRRSLWPMLLGLLVTAGVIVAIALGTSNSDNGAPSSSASTPSPAAPSNSAPPPATGNAPAKLAPVGTGKSTGTAAVSGKSLKLQVRGLPAAHYEVWLYNSILDARSIGTGDGASFTVKASLPAGWKRFRYVDVSRERRDGNVSHSGESVLRVPTSSLR